MFNSGNRTNSTLQEQGVSNNSDLWFVALAQNLSEGFLKVS